MMAGFVNKILDMMATTHMGQSAIKKVDLMLWSLETPAKYAVDGEKKGDGRNMPWPVFWIILINMQIIRVICSTILIQFNKNPIESIDIVKTLQKWRRTLRSIRFRGLRSMREKQYGKTDASIKDVTTSPLETSKKRNHDEMLHHDLLEELMNRTFADSDHTDSTFMISKFDDISTNSSSHDGQSISDDYQSPLKSKESLDSSLQDTLPISASESEQQEPNMSTKSNEVTFVSTVDDTEESAFALTEEDSGHSLNGHSKHGEGNESPPAEPTVQPDSDRKIGKESLNVPIDPVDALMFNLEQRDDVKVNSKKSGKNNRKKRIFSLGSQENIERQSAMKASKSQESINKL